MKKILFILPCVPYPLTAGGNQAFFNMVEYIRHKMSVSLLLSPENKEMNDVESLRALWTNVDFYLFREEDAEPKTRCPRYYRWLKKMSESISRKMQRQLYSFQQERPYKNMTLKNSCFKPFPKAYRLLSDDILIVVPGQYYSNICWFLQLVVASHLDALFLILPFLYESG